MSVNTSKSYYPSGFNRPYLNSHHREKSTPISHIKNIIPKASHENLKLSYNTKILQTPTKSISKSRQNNPINDQNVHPKNHNGNGLSTQFSIFNQSNSNHKPLQPNLKKPLSNSIHRINIDHDNNNHDINSLAFTKDLKAKSNSLSISQTGLFFSNTNKHIINQTFNLNNRPLSAITNQQDHSIHQNLSNHNTPSNSTKSIVNKSKTPTQNTIHQYVNNNPSYSINETITNMMIQSRRAYKSQKQNSTSSFKFNDLSNSSNTLLNNMTATPRMHTPTKQYQEENYSKYILQNSTASTSTSMLSSNLTYIGNGTTLEPRGIIGLRNIGNTCFMNCILQCLFNAPRFSQYFAKGIYSKDLNANHKDIAISFGNMIEKIHKYIGLPSHSRTESIYEFKKALERVCPTFCGYDQQDAQEFLKALLVGLNDDLNRNRIKQPYKELIFDSKKSIQQMSDEWFNYYIDRDNSIVTDMFCGQLLNKIICLECNHESLSFDNFWDLSLSFTNNIDTFDIDYMFDNFLKEELLEDLYKCEKCKTTKRSKKRFIIWKIPNILVIHLKRFHYARYRRAKLKNNIIFPLKGLNLKPYLNESTDPTAKDCIYDLFGIVHHDGDLCDGHYTAECMNQYDKKWYRFNDHHITEIWNSIEEYTKNGSDSPYLLFYVKR